MMRKWLIHGCVLAAGICVASSSMAQSNERSSAVRAEHAACANDADAARARLGQMRAQTPPRLAAALPSRLAAALHNALSESPALALREAAARIAETRADATTSAYRPTLGI